MKNSVLMAALLLAAALTTRLYGQTAMPLIRDVEPASGTYGDVFTAAGDNLEPAQVAALYLTDGTKDTKVVITEQTAEAIKFQIPAGMPKGRFALMILTKGKDAKLIEEPVKVTIEPPKPATS